MNVLPLADEKLPLVLQELLFTLKIRDAMTRTVITVQRHDTLRQAQDIMRTRGITGVPVAEDDRLFGIVSMDDILRAMEGGWMDNRVDRHMSTQVVVLEEEMPLTFGATYFEKYKFGRFPVLSRDNRLVGILSSRDVSSALLLALYREFDKRESERPGTAQAASDPALLQFRVQRFDFENAGKASHEIKKKMVGRGFPAKLVRRVAVAAYEMEMNQVVHSYGGRMYCRIGDDRVDIAAEDNGPGIANVDEALQEGFTTANDWVKSLGFGAGMGLSNIRRVSDEFDIRSQLGASTQVRVRIFLPSPQPASENEVPTP